MTFAIVVAIVSIVLPMGIVAAVVFAEMRDKGIAGSPSKMQRAYYGFLSQGELWHTDVKSSSNPFAPPIETRVMRLDLETGVERDTGLVVPG